MSAAKWPDTLEEAVKANVNVYIDASASMLGPMKGSPFDMAVQFVRRHRAGSRVFAFSHAGVRQIDDVSLTHGGGDGLPLALDHARKQRRRALVISDGGHSPIEPRAQSWAIALISGPSILAASREHVEKLGPARVYEFPNNVSARSAGYADKMAKASRNALAEQSARHRDWVLQLDEKTPSPDRAKLELLAEEVVRLSKREAPAARNLEALLAANVVVAAKRERDTADRRLKAKDAWEELARLTYSCEPDVLNQPDVRVAQRFRESATTLLDYLDHMQEGSS